MVNDCTGRVIETLDEFNENVEDHKYYGNLSAWLVV